MAKTIPKKAAVIVTLAAIPGRGAKANAIGADVAQQGHGVYWVTPVTPSR